MPRHPMGGAAFFMSPKYSLSGASDLPKCRHGQRISALRLRQADIFADWDLVKSLAALLSLF